MSTTVEIALNKHRAHELLAGQAAQQLALSVARFQALAEGVSDYAILLLDPAGG